MDLFSLNTPEEPDEESVSNALEALLTFVKAMNDEQVKSVEITLERVDFELWRESTRGLHAMSNKLGLSSHWDATVEKVTEARKGFMWDARWDACYDHAVALTFKAYVGEKFPHRWYELLTTPLTEAGLRINS